MSTPRSTATMGSFERYNRIAGSIGAFTLEKIIYSMIVPVIAKWHWATLVNEDNYVTSTPASVIDTKTLVYANISECQLPSCLDDGDDVAAQMKINPTLLIVFLSTPIVSIVLAPAGGCFGDTVGFDLSMLVGLVIAAIISVLFASSSAFLVVLTARILLGFLVAFTHGNTLGRAFQVVTPETHEGNIVVGFFLASYAFQFFGPSFCGLLFKYFGQVAAFLSLLPLEIILAMSVIVTYQFPSTLQRKNSGPLTPQDLDTNLSATSSHQKNKTPTFLDVISDHRILIFSLILTISWLPKCSLEPILAIWIKQQFNGDAGTTSLVWGIAGFAVLAASFISIYVLKYCSDNTFLYTVFHFASSALPIGLLPFMSSPAGAAVGFMLNIYFASAAKYGAMNIIASIAEKEYEPVMGRVMAIANIGFVLPYLIAPLISIPLYNTLGFHHMCLILSPITVIFALLFYFILTCNKPRSLSQLYKEETIYEPEYIKEQDLPHLELTEELIQPVNKDEPQEF